MFFVCWIIYSLPLYENVVSNIIYSYLYYIVIFIYSIYYFLISYPYYVKVVLNMYLFCNYSKYNIYFCTKFNVKQMIYES